MKDITIRTAALTDAAAILKIYEPYITDTAITFEYDIPSLEEFTSRIQHTLEMYPYYVAEQDGKIVGYAYASAFKGRKAYDWSVETSIYIERTLHGQGIGKKLYEVLEDTLKKQGIRNVNACIAYTEQEDQYLTNDSMYFHEHYGYELVGTFHKCAWKFDKWYDMIWMEKMLAPHENEPDDIIPFPELSE